MKSYRSKYWNDFLGALEHLYPKGDEGRGKALLLLSYIELIAQGKKHLIEKMYDK